MQIYIRLVHVHARVQQIGAILSMSEVNFYPHLPKASTMKGTVEQGATGNLQW